MNIFNYFNMLDLNPFRIASISIALEPSEIGSFTLGCGMDFYASSPAIEYPSGSCY